MSQSFGNSNAVCTRAVKGHAHCRSTSHCRHIEVRSPTTSKKEVNSCMLRDGANGKPKTIGIQQDWAFFLEMKCQNRQSRNRLTLVPLKSNTFSFIYLFKKEQKIVENKVDRASGIKCAMTLKAKNRLRLMKISARL